MCFIFDSLIDKFYYINLLPVMADIELFKYILNRRLPFIASLQKKLFLDVNLILIPCFVTIFTNINNFNFKKVVFDWFLCEGVHAFFRIGLVIFKKMK